MTQPSRQGKRTRSLVTLEVFQSAEMLLTELAVEALRSLAPVMRPTIASDGVNGVARTHFYTLLMQLARCTSDETSIPRGDERSLATRHPSKVTTVRKLLGVPRPLALDGLALDP